MSSSLFPMSLFRKQDKVRSDPKMKKLGSPKAVALCILGLIYLIAFPVYFRDSNYVLNIVITSSILSCISMGVWLVFAIGRINIGQAAFVLIGGYTTAILSTKLGVSFWICLPLSGIVAGLVGFLIGIPILRLKGVYFDMLTLVITGTATLVMLNLEKLTNGARGIMNIPLPGALSVGDITIIPAFQPGNYLYFYYLSAFVLLVTLAGVWRLYTCRIGWIFQALRQSDTLALSSGINIAKYRLLAYTICCLLGGIGGSLFTAHIQCIYPASFKIMDSIYYMLYCFLGGLDFMFGPIVGAFLLTSSFEGLRVIQKYQEGIFACLMIAFMLWLPNGILSLRLRRRSGASRGIGTQNGHSRTSVWPKVKETLRQILERKGT
jgi:branched-chain amino acid transport system permease protein